MIVKIEDLKNINLEELLSFSKNENYKLIFKLISDYKSGINRFDKNGEILVCYKENNKILGICGLNIEPQSELINTARIRRLYILPKFRKKQIGKKLVHYLLEYAKNYFNKVTTNIGDLNISNFYISCGFNQVDNISGITHITSLHT